MDLKRDSRMDFFFVDVFVDLKEHVLEIFDKLGGENSNDGQGSKLRVLN